MKTVILCGGKGTRMREETEYKPKPMVEIGGIPMLCHIMNTYSHCGFNDFILCLGYKANMIKEYFLNYKSFSNDFTLSIDDNEIIFYPKLLPSWNITFADTGEDTPTGGRIKNIEKYICDDEFFMTYGDGLSNIDINALLSYHRLKNKIVTLTGTKPRTRFGLLDIRSDGIAKSFSEKPQSEPLINGGFYVLKSTIFDLLENNSIFEEDILPSLTDLGELAVYQHRSFWVAIDTYKEVEEINKQWNAGDRPWIL